MVQLFRGDGGYACDMVLENGNWCLAYISVADVDKMFVEDFGRYVAKLKSGVSEADWMRSLTSTPRQLHFVRQSNNGTSTTCLAQAERLDGPAMLDGAPPAVVWTQRSGNRWSLMAHEGNETKMVFEYPNPLRNPAACRDSDGQLWCACDFREAGQDMFAVLTDAFGLRVQVQILGKNSSEISIPGRRPRLVSGIDGAVWLTFERAEREFSHVYLQNLQESAKTFAVKLSSGDELNFTAHPIINEDGRVLVIWENAPSWGEDEQFGRFRRIILKEFDPHSQKILDGPGTEEGAIPIPISAFRDSHVQNRIPLNPLLLNTSEGLMCAYRIFRFSGHKSFGWDVFETNFDGESWSAPHQLTKHFGFADTPYRVIPKGESLLVAVHCCEHLPRATFAEQKQESAQRANQHTWGHRVELWEVPINEKVEEKPLEYETLKVVVPKSVISPALEPASLLHPPSGLRLIWGDLHAHSCFSKCMSANDGMPADVLRWQRDIIGCRVLCTTEHVEYCSSVEFIRSLDLVEAEAAENDIIPLYGVEWAKYPAHHTNLFCIDRQIFEQLRAVLLRLDHLSKIYRKIKEEFPPNSVVAIRHFHGMTQGQHNVLAEDVAATHDPEIEWTMEAAQIRGDMMFSPPKNYATFPANFLMAGARIGLIAASDHARGGPLKFCLTGFWVNEVTPQAVFDALRERRTIGAISGKMAVWLKAPNVEMGQAGNATLPIQLVAELASAHPLRNIRLWRDGEWIAQKSLSSHAESVVLQDEKVSPGEHCYIVRAEAEPTVANLPVVSYSSPIWLRVQ